MCVSQVYQLGGIPTLVTLLESSNPGVSQGAAGALRNLVFKHHNNKMEVQNCSGISKSLRLLKETDSTETQKQITGWTFLLVYDLEILGSIHLIPYAYTYNFTFRMIWRPAVEPVLCRWAEGRAYSYSTASPDWECGGAIHLLVRQHCQQQHTPWCLLQRHRVPAVRTFE